MKMPLLPLKQLCVFCVNAFHFHGGNFWRLFPTLMVGYCELEWSSRLVHEFKIVIVLELVAQSPRKNPGMLWCTRQEQRLEAVGQPLLLEKEMVIHPLATAPADWFLRLCMSGCHQPPSR